MVLRHACGSLGKRLYAIGDVHGCYDLLIRLLTKIHEHCSERDKRETSIVLLGDLIDKGPRSAHVLELLRVADPDDYKLYALMGNHEELMLRAVGGDPLALRIWLKSGGHATLSSYGIAKSMIEKASLVEIQRKLATAIPKSHLTLLRSFSDSILFGDYLLVHAGIRPGIALERQVSSDLRWIGDPFRDSSADHGFVVVHGHSQSLELEDRANRIGLDTGAHQTGVLTALWIEDDQRGLLQARREIP